MKLKDIKIEHIIIAGLAIAIAVMFMFSGGKDRAEMNVHEDNVEDLAEDREIITDDIKRSLARIPGLERTVDSLLTELDTKEYNLKLTQKNYEKLIDDINAFSVTGDIEFYSNYLSSREDDFR